MTCPRPENPFRHIPKVNAEVDIRHQRRPLSAEEFTRLVGAARCGRVFRGLSGPDRVALYIVAGMTGLRTKELGSLSLHSFTLDADPPVVAVEAAYSKHRRRDEIPLHPELVAELRVWLAEKPANEPLWLKSMRATVTPDATARPTLPSSTESNSTRTGLASLTGADTDRSGRRRATRAEGSSVRGLIPAPVGVRIACTGNVPPVVFSIRTTEAGVK